MRVWRTGKTGGNPKDKEILILLSNPGIKELLLERIEAAITFIRLIQNNSDEVAIKKVKEAVSMFLMDQDLEDYVQAVRSEALEFLHLGEPYKFTEEAKEGKWRFIDNFKKELQEVKKRIENGEREIFKKNVKIELGYLFSLDKKVVADLDRSLGSEISEELKKELVDKGVSLENIKEVTKSGDEWVIGDKMTKLIVRPDERELKVYTPEAAKEWSSIKRSEVEQIIKEEMRSLGVKTETGPAGPVISEQIIGEIARLEKERVSPEEIDDLRKKINSLEAMISASVSEEITPSGDSISKESEERNKKIHSEYLDFDLEIRDARGREYPVSVIRSPAGEAREMMHFPFSELQLEGRLKDLKIALLQSGGKHRMVLSPEEQTVQDFGRNLFDALFIGELRSRYDVSLANAAEQGKGLRLKLRIKSPELAALPWEFLYNSRQAEYVCLSRNTPVVRYLELPQPIQPLTLATPLSILGMVVSPRDLPKLDTEREKLRVEEAIKDLQAKGRVNLTWLKGQTWRDLLRAMRGGTWHVFHFIGHGGFDHNSDEGFIALADEEGNTHKLSATQLGRLLGDHRHLRLALLNACEGARGSERDIFSSTAAILVRRGIPAVLAMQYEITDLAAIEFAQTFYESLADEMPVDAAVAEARKAISLRLTNTVEWGTPVLYMRTPDGVLFRIEGQEQGK